MPTCGGDCCVPRWRRRPAGSSGRSSPASVLTDAGELGGTQQQLSAGARLAADQASVAASSVTSRQNRLSLEASGYARAMMRQMPSRLALSESHMAHMAYSKSHADITTPVAGDPEAQAPDFSQTRMAPSLIRYEKDVGRLVDIIDGELRAQGHSVLTEYRKINRLRELPVSLTTKREVKHRLEDRLTREASAERLTTFRIHTKFIGHKIVWTLRFLKEVHDLVHIWHEQLKTIEGNFGQNVGLYFRFLRWLLIVNMQVFVISLLFLVLPQMAHTIYKPDEARRSAMGIPSPDPIQVHNGSSQAYNRPQVPRVPLNFHRFSIANVLTGQGWLLFTPMYYGFYYRGMINFTGTHYHMPLAYFNIAIICIVFQLVMLARSTATSYRKNFIDVSTDTSGNVANLIFAGWDSRVTSQQLAELKRFGLYCSFQKKIRKKELVEEQAAASADPEMARARTLALLYTVVVRVASNLLVLAVLMGITYLTYNVMMLDSQIKGDSPISLLASAFLISLVLAVFPLLFHLIGLFEAFRHPRALMFITLVRMVAMSIIILGTIILYWMQVVASHPTEAPETEEAARLRGHDRIRCWETEVGSELYQLMIVDLLFTVVLETGLEFARKIAHRLGILWTGEPFFEIPRSIMFLIYSQTLVWVGTYFCPLLTLVACLKLVITFYVRKWSLEYNCSPQSRSVRASQTHTLFRLVAFSACFLAALFMVYILFYVRPSKHCGPFQMHSTPWNIVNDTLNEWKHQGHTMIYGIVRWSHQPGMVAVWLLVFSVVAYYMRSLAMARQEMIVLLKGQLVLEGQDKVTLLELIEETANKLQKDKEGTSVTVLVKPGQIISDEPSPKVLDKRAKAAWWVPSPQRRAVARARGGRRISRVHPHRPAPITQRRATRPQQQPRRQQRANSRQRRPSPAVPAGRHMNFQRGYRDGGGLRASQAASRRPNQPPASSRPDGRLPNQPPASSQPDGRRPNQPLASSQPDGRRLNQPPASSRPDSSRRGNPAGNLAGNPAGNPAGNLAGNRAGNPAGNPPGNPAGNLPGNIAGNPPGNPAGNPHGNPAGNPPGNPAGNPPGNPAGNPPGNPAGNPHGNPAGSDLSGSQAGSSSQPDSQAGSQQGSASHSQDATGKPKGTAKQRQDVTEAANFWSKYGRKQ